eukprot:COSAG02_NODE_66775_length_254_cov_1.206452_1_plen_79_part_01
MVIGLSMLFQWLRDPVIRAIEPEDSVSVADATKVVLCCFDTTQTRLGNNILRQMQTAEKYLKGENHDGGSRVAAGRNSS